MTIMSRPKKKLPIREYTFGIRLTPAERQRIEKCADKLSLRASQWARAVLLREAK